MCKATIMDNITAGNKIVHQQSTVGGGIATALRDRRPYVIPKQPNLSLPVHPVPFHCRTSIIRVKSPLQGGKLTLFKRIQPASGAQDEKGPPGAEQEENKTKNEKRDKIVPLSRLKDQEKEEGLKGGEKRTIEFSEELSSWMIRMSKMTQNNEKEVKKSEETVENRRREGIMDEKDERTRDFRATGSEEKEREGIARVKKRHRRSRKERKWFNWLLDEEGLEGSCKTVPPLRLKKVEGPGDRLGTSALVDQEPCLDGDSSWEKKSQRNKGRKIFENNYRIVTGDTPPYENRSGILEDQEDNGDCRPSTDETCESLEKAKLAYKRTKLRLKLRELEKKTIILGEETLRTVIISSSTNRSRHFRQRRVTMNRYARQMKHLKRLLSELPITEYGAAEEEPHQEEEETVEGEEKQEEKEEEGEYEEGTNWELENIIRNPEKGNREKSPEENSDRSSVRSSSPSLEPPKLSPRSPIRDNDEEGARSPGELWDSPPILPRVYVCIPDRKEPSRPGKRTRIPRESKKRRKRSKISIPEVLGEEECRKIECEEVKESVVEPESRNGQEFSVDVFLEDDETKYCNESDDVTKDMENFGPVGDDTSFKDIFKVNDEERCDEEDDKSSLEIVDAKSEILEVVQKVEYPKDVTSADEVTDLLPSEELGEIKEKQFMTAVEENSCQLPVSMVSTVAPVEPVIKTNNNSHAAAAIPISEQFPTFGKWIAELSNDHVKDTLPVEKLPGFYQEEILSCKRPEEPEVPKNAISQPVDEEEEEEESGSGSQWIREENWQEESIDERLLPLQRQPQQQQRVSPRSYCATDVPAAPVAPAVPLQPPPIAPEFARPTVALTRLYTRNYPSFDQYGGVAYGYNPASLWNSAALLQYPLIRPTLSSLPHHHRAQTSAAEAPYEVSELRVAPETTENANRPNYSTLRAPNRFGRSSMRTGCPEFENSAGVAESNYRNLLQQQFERILNYGNPELRLASAATVAPTSGFCPRDVNFLAKNSASGFPTNWPNGIVEPPSDIYLTRNPGAAAARPLVRACPISEKPIDDSWRFLAHKNEPNANHIRNCETPNLGKVLDDGATANSRPIECSNCGLPGCMFKCLGCQVAFYCNENCQARHWNRHVISCPKKMPKLKKLVQ